MREQTLIRFLQRLGFTDLKRSGLTHFKVPCLYQETKHERGFDTRPSATVSIDTTPSWFRCFACETKRPFWKAVLDNALHNPGQNWARMAIEMRDIEDVEGKTTLRRPTTAPLIDTPTNMSSSIQRLIEGGALDYPAPVLELLLEKGVPKETARKLLWCFVPEGYADEHMKKEDDEIVPAQHDCLLFPTLVKTDTDIICVGGQARPLRLTRRMSKYTTLLPYNAGYYLYAEHLLHRWRGKPLCVVEGPLDTAHLISLGFPAVGLFGLHATQARVRKIADRHGGPVFVFLDPDKAGTGSVDKVTAALKQGIRSVQVLKANKDPKFCSVTEVATLTGFDPRL
jgi:5S rRNA maturation endonuclease (ribonuclease M5)